MSVLVTGGTGFIGRYVLDRLRDGGERVVSYDRAPAPGLPAGVTAVRGEIFDLAGLAGTIVARDARAVVHAAGFADAEQSVETPATTVTANAVGTLDVLEACRIGGFGGRVVLLSSMRVYGDEDDDERVPATLRPRTPFAVTKAFGDLLGQVYVDRYGLDVVSLRLSDVYGPGRRLPRFVEALLEHAAAGRAPALPPGRPRPGRLLHAEDAARAVVAALRAPSPLTRVYDIAGEPVLPEQILAVAHDRAPHAAPEWEPPCSTPSAPIARTPADAELGYRPRWSLARGIDDYCTWSESEEAC
jgi:UDP-glucose 4-epimerase